jgi:sulfoxide reductase heme-binding subunit YedZ
MTTWIILRAAGIAAYLMLFASVAWGVVATTSAMGKRVPKATAVAVHQFVSTVALLFLGIHLGGLLLDRFVPFRPLDMLIPLHSSFRPAAVASGIVAMYAMVVVLVSSWTRKQIGTKVWRALHVLAAPAFTMSMIHGVMAGTDTVRPWMWLTYLVTGSIVLFLVVVRGLTVGIRAARAARPETARPQISPADLRAREAGAHPPGAPASGGPTGAPRAHGTIGLMLT